MITSETKYFIADLQEQLGIKKLLKNGFNSLQSGLYKIILKLADPDIMDKKYKLVRKVVLASFLMLEQS